MYKWTNFEHLKLFKILKYGNGIEAIADFFATHISVNSSKAAKSNENKKNKIVHVFVWITVTTINVIITFYTIRKWLYTTSFCIIINVFWWSSLKAFDAPLLNLVRCVCVCMYLSLLLLLLLLLLLTFYFYSHFIYFSIALFFYSFMVHAYANGIYSRCSLFAGFRTNEQNTNLRRNRFSELNENANTKVMHCYLCSW